MDTGSVFCPSLRLTPSPRPIPKMWSLLWLGNLRNDREIEIHMWLYAFFFLGGGINYRALRGALHVALLERITGFVCMYVHAS